MTSFIASNNYSFPRLQPPVIIKCLSELGLSITKDELLRPEDHKESVKNILLYLSEICLGITRDDYSQPAFTGLQVMNYPGLHEESIPQFHILKNIMKLMETCDINDFTIKDLISPNSSRLIRQLSAIINFAKFREERLNMLQEITRTRDTLCNTLDQIIEKYQATENRLSILKDQFHEENRMIESMENDCSMFSNNIQKKNKDIQNHNTTIQSLQMNIETILKNIDEKNRELEMGYKQKETLSKQIVSNPESFRSNILEIGNLLQAEQKDVKINEKKTKELILWSSTLDEVFSEVMMALNTIQDIRSEVEKQKTIVGDLETLRRSGQQLATIITEVKQNNTQYNKSTQRMEEKIINLRSQSTSKNSDLIQRMESLHQEIVESESSRVHVS